ncbi:REP element-mobilizing transposase RayT [Flavobacterium nitrogenifigens]|uniref:REP element-mobilizing transposase RayT n=2 Tax=Flavobacterium TaxID=237 RepID=A0A7W7J094_9FLAO|nr:MULTISPECIES: transposase [Flavobacterium]MBB4803175.1 REP element-mobilizing transposase RayT [Flavobacterium nitrogenifigens]MBB6388133.1 REP element-mobilizing transposase RayT [Flavobacterium notoginsengisoli]
MDIRIQNLEPNCFYHIYNRGVNGDIVFQNNDNYMFFMVQFRKYLNEVCDLYAYCLMPNHFHFVIKIKSKKELLDFFEEKNKRLIKKGLHAMESLASKQLSKFISSYTQAYNKVFDRHGPLFESPFKRKKIDSEKYLRNLIIYVHQNPSDIGKDFRTYRFSSYITVLSTLKTSLKRDEVIECFEDLENFVFCHNSVIDFKF